MTELTEEDIRKAFTEAGLFLHRRAKKPEYVMTDRMCDQKIYRVGTFWHADSGKNGRATGYLRWFNPNWPGCIIYEIAAQNGREAVKTAMKMRAEKEQSR